MHFNVLISLSCLLHDVFVLLLIVISLNMSRALYFISLLFSGIYFRNSCQFSFLAVLNFRTRDFSICNARRPIFNTFTKLLIYSRRTEFKAYTDVKPVKPIKAKSQYKLLEGGKTNLETSYNATFKGEQGKPQTTDNKVMERRRIRSLYNEPSKESSKVFILRSS